VFVNILNHKVTKNDDINNFTVQIPVIQIFLKQVINIIKIFAF